MKNALKTLRALPLALIMALGIAGFTPTHAVADEASTVDNQFVDGNWFSIAADKGEAYKVGSSTNQALQTQIDAYEGAKTDGDVVKEEHFAIRSWVKGWCAAEEGRLAFVAGDLTKAKSDFSRAKKLGLKAQKPEAGKGEKASCGGSNGAFEGCSAEEGVKVVAYCDRWLAKVGGGDE